MSEEMNKKPVETTFADEDNTETEDVATPEPKPEAPKPEEKSEPKVNPVVKVLTTIGKGIAKAGAAVGGVAKKHPYITATATGVLGYVVRGAVDNLVESRTKTETGGVVTPELTTAEPLSLPETEDVSTDDFTTPSVEAVEEVRTEE